MARDRAEIAVAKEALSSIYQSFEEGLQMPDLVAARALLAEL
jgi:hypothetical protein